MNVDELVENSPIRVFEESIHGGLGKGNVGVLASRRGVGKTACLVHLATDKLFRGEHVIHVSFSGNVEHVLNWYKEVFGQIARHRSLEDSVSVYETIRENRVVMNFSQKNVSVDKIIKSLEALIKMGSFEADCVLFDGYSVGETTSEDIKKIKAFATEMGIEVWISVSDSLPGAACDRYGIPESLEAHVSLADILIGLRYNEEKSKVIMTVVRDRFESPSHPTGVNLDPHTMLITQ